MKFLKTRAQVLVIAAAALCCLPAFAENLYDEARFRPLTADLRAREIGDLLTVLVVESSTAESRADSSESGDFSVEAGVTDDGAPSIVGFNIESDSNGAGRTARTGRLRAQLSVRVEEVLANGNLYVRGRQAITVNGEQQDIKLAGIVRPVDISSDNVVLSSRIMDAQIEYTGQGWVSRSQRPGVFRRLLQFLGF